MNELEAELAALRDENTKLKTVMISAAEEIHTHWDAHCDAEGYGPQNLMRRLEEGIPSEYGYTAGAFAALLAERDALLTVLKSVGLFLHHCWCDVQMNEYSFGLLNQQLQIVDAAIDAAKEQR